MNPTRHPKSELVCSHCGRPEAFAIGDEILCAGCCHERGSCGAVREASDDEAVLPATSGERKDPDG